MSSTTTKKIAELEARIAELKAALARKKAQASPAVKHTTAAIRAIDSALAETDAHSMKVALQEARATLVACLAVDGVVLAPREKTRVRRSARSLEALGHELLEFVRQNPGQRGEQIAARLGTDVGTLRLPMKQLIAEGRVKTRGQRRGMTYFPA